MHAAKLTAALLVLAAQLLLTGSASAADYPSRPIKLLVGASAGGTTDTMARTIAEPLSALFGQPVLVENRPGVGGNLAAEAVARAAPDGYTLLVSFTSHTINATLYPKLPFDPVASFSPIAMISTVPSLLVGNPRLPAQDLKALIALAREKPGKLTIGIGGIGSSLHLAGDRFKMMAGVDILNVPYKGTAPALTDVLGGQVDLMFISLVTGSAQVQAGNLRAYGVTSAARQPSFPDLPAIGEVVPGFESEAWFGLFGPAKLPDAIVAKLNQAILGVLKDPRMRERLMQEGANPAAMTPAEFAKFVREDIERWAPVVRSSGAKPN
jgi:tripartite-type tricarboxylate transporter receptor subunit TctC